MKKNMTNTREGVTRDLWQMTEETMFIREDDWLMNATKRLLVRSALAVYLYAR